ncbi:MAG: P-loop NTPase fold protein [Methanoregula sp.]
MVEIQTDDVKNIKILGDSPTNNATYFNFDSYITTFLQIIQDSQIETPFTIAIDGKWGSGKTSLMKTIREKLKNGSSKRKIKTVWFDAWKYSEQDSLLAELAFEIYQEVINEKGIIKSGIVFRYWRKIHYFFTRSKRINSLNIISDFSNVLISSVAITYGIVPLEQNKLDIKKWVNEPIYEKNLTFYRRFQQFLDGVMDVFVFNNVSRSNSEDDGFLVIFIDDLDRCSPKAIANILESINLFFDQKGCLFIIGMDLNMVSKAIEIHYKDFESSGVFSGREYLKKMIQLEFSLPEIREKNVKEYIEREIGIDPSLQESINLIIQSLQGNPREIKRFINSFKFLKLLQSNRKNWVMNDELLIKWILSNFVSGEFVNAVKNDPGLLIALQEYAQSA